MLMSTDRKERYLSAARKRRLWVLYTWKFYRDSFPGTGEEQNGPEIEKASED